MKKLLCTVCFATAVFLLALYPVSASEQTLSVVCSPSCTKTGADPLFSRAQDGYWYPGLTKTKTLELTNADAEEKEMAMRATRTSSSSFLEDVLSVSITNKDTFETVWSGNLSDLYNQDRIDFGTFDRGQRKAFSLLVSMNPHADNDYQSTQSTFDLRLGFWAEEEVSSSGGSGTSGTSGTQGTGTVAETAPTNTPSLLHTIAQLTGPEVLGETDEAVRPKTKETDASPFARLGSGATCQKSWWLLLLLELPVLLFITRALQRCFEKRRYLLSERIAGGVSVAVLWFLLCSMWLLLVAAGIVYVCMVLLYKKHKRSPPEEKQPDIISKMRRSAGDDLSQ